MTKVTKIVLATAAATGLSFGPVLACPYMKTAEEKKAMITAKADVQMSTTDSVVLKPVVETPAEATPATEKPADPPVSIE